MTDASRPGDILAFEPLAQAVLQAARGRGARVITAESCTGGMIVAALTAVAGSSDVVEGGLVTYANEAKVRLLGVGEDLLASHGAVSEAVARAMAEGALNVSGASASVAVTGVAGPGGGSPDKPVGLVHFATAMEKGQTLHARVNFGDIGRAQVRAETVRMALRMLLERLA